MLSEYPTRIKDNNNLMDINWKELAKEYKEHYDDDDGIHEYVEGLLPIYFGEIYSTYHEYIGTPLNIEIEKEHVGRQFWQIMNEHLYDEFMNHFMEEYSQLEEE